MPHHAAGVYQACLNVLGLEPRIAFEYRRRVVAGRQHPQYVLDGQPATSDNRLAAENTRHDRDSIEQICSFNTRIPVLAFAIIIHLWRGAERAEVLAKGIPRKRTRVEAMGLRLRSRRMNVHAPARSVLRKPEQPFPATDRCAGDCAARIRAKLAFLSDAHLYS